jgi:hypothetical protein
MVCAGSKLPVEEDVRRMMCTKGNEETERKTEK